MCIWIIRDISSSHKIDRGSGYGGWFVPSRVVALSTTRQRDIAPTHQRDIAITRHRDNAPTRHRANAPTRHRDNAPTRHRDNAPTRHRDNATSRLRDNDDKDDYRVLIIFVKHRYHQKQQIPNKTKISFCHLPTLREMLHLWRVDNPYMIF